MPAKIKQPTPPAAYRALVVLTYPVGEENIARAQAGDMAAVTEWKEHGPDDGPATDIPASSVPWLLARGLIEPTDAEPVIAEPEPVIEQVVEADAELAEEEVVDDGL